MPPNLPSTLQETAPARGPEAMTVAAVALLSICAWASLMVEAARAPDAAGLLDVICRPSALGSTGAGWTAAIAPTFALWFVMCLAMMLPTSVPMLLNAVDRIDTRVMGAGRSRLAAGALLAGYGAVWAILSGAAAVGQSALSAIVSTAALPAPALAVATGAALGFAGLYQFSDLKQRFLAACRHPVTELPDGSAPLGAFFRLGLAQANRCLGCCAAVMALMGIAGLMNLAWMGAFAIAMTVERVTTGQVVPRIIGVALLAAGLFLAVSGVGIDRVIAALLAR